MRTGFWTGAQIRFTSGNNDGLIRRVTTLTPGSSQFTVDALPTGTTTNDKYEIDQYPVLPDHLHHLMIYYAAAGLAPKRGIDRTRFIERWEKEFEDIRRRYQDNIDANVPGSRSQGINDRMARAIT